MISYRAPLVNDYFVTIPLVLGVQTGLLGDALHVIEDFLAGLRLSVDIGNAVFLHLHEDQAVGGDLAVFTTLQGTFFISVTDGGESA